MLAAFLTRTGPPEVIQYGELPRPLPGNGEVLVRMEAVSVNPVDCYARAGMLPGQLPSPWIPGSDIAGTVESVGPGVRGFLKGDRVWATNQGFAGRQGTFAEYCSVQQDWLQHLPDGVSAENAAALSLVGVTAHLGLVQRVGLQPGQTLFVRGAGGAVGSTVVQMATAIGARVFASAGSDAKVAAARELGAVDAVNYRTGDVAAGLRRFAPAGVDVAWDTTRDPDFLSLVPALAERGQIVLMAGRDAQPRFPVGPFYVKQCSMHGIIMLKMSAAEMRRAADDLNHWLASGSISPRIAVRMPLAKTAEAHRMQERTTLETDGSLAGKIVLFP